MPISRDGPGWWLLYEPALPMTEHTTMIDGVDLYFRMAGSGPPLLLLHGRTGSGQIWMPHIDALGEKFTVIVPDLPGHGRSTAFPGDFSHRRVATMMFRLADKLGYTQMRGLGWSSGAFVLIHMGVQQPERMAAMVLVGGSHRSSLQHRQWVRSVPEDGWGGDRREVLLCQHPGGERQVREIFAQFRKQADDHPDFDLSPEHLAVTQARTLVVLGDQDTQQPVEFAVELYRAIPDSSLWIVPGRGHEAGMLSERHTFLATVLRFFSDEWPS